jgi:hypothetical protein
MKNNKRKTPSEEKSDAKQDDFPPPPTLKRSDTCQIKLWALVGRERPEPEEKHSKNNSVEFWKNNRPSPRKRVKVTPPVPVFAKGPSLN